MYFFVPMSKELYLYSPMFNFVAEDLIASIEENKDEDIVIRANTPGGSVFSGWGIIAKMKEHSGNITMKVDGSVASMGTFMTLFADNVEALDVSKIMLHRADMFVENAEDQKFLDDINKDLKQKLKAKIDNDKLKELKGIGIDELFNSEKRIDLWLTAQEAKKIGLVNKITKLNPVEAKAYTDKYFAIAATADPKKPEIDTPEIDEPEKNINKTKLSEMSIETLKAENPKLYKEVFAKGILAERDRVGSWATFLDVDAEKVIKAIKEGDELTATETAELTRKSVTAKALENVESDGEEEVETEETEAAKTEKDKKVEAFEKQVETNLGINKAK